MMDLIETVCLCLVLGMMQCPDETYIEKLAINLAGSELPPSLGLKSFIFKRAPFSDLATTGTGSVGLHSSAGI